LLFVFSLQNCKTSLYIPHTSSLLVILLQIFSFNVWLYLLSYVYWRSYFLILMRTHNAKNEYFLWVCLIVSLTFLIKYMTIFN
jgi:hypothetical protein